MAKEKKITLKQLSEADRDKLFKQFEAQKIEKEKKQAKGRADYKDLVDVTIIKVLPVIQEVSNRLAEVKNKVIDSFQSLISGTIFRIKLLFQLYQ